MQIPCDWEQDESIIWNEFIIWQVCKILPVLQNVKHGADHGFSFLYACLKEFH